MIHRSAASETSLLHLPRCYYSAEESRVLLAQVNVLAVIDFTNQCCPSGEAKHFNTGLALIGPNPTREVWLTDSAVESGIQDSCYWSTDGNFLFAGLWVSETTENEYHLNIQAAYQKLLAFTQERSYNHIVRIWNYLPRINEGSGDRERYKQFCLGRQQAFENQGFAPQTYPAACAIGHQGSHTVIYLLASKSPSLHFENPKQISAYDYPRQYGPKSPSFARATLLRDGEISGQIYLSGTASVIGHETLHPNQLQEQLKVTLDNIDALLDSIKTKQRSSSAPVLDPIKVYLRQASDYPLVLPLLQKHFGDHPTLLFVKGDICRSELTLEIDGIASL